jgi:hypothetical protein
MAVHGDRASVVLKNVSQIGLGGWPNERPRDSPATGAWRCWAEDHEQSHRSGVAGIRNQTALSAAWQGRPAGTSGVDRHLHCKKGRRRAVARPTSRLLRTCSIAAIPSQGWIQRGKITQLKTTSGRNRLNILAVPPTTMTLLAWKVASRVMANELYSCCGRFVPPLLYPAPYLCNLNLMSYSGSYSRGRGAQSVLYDLYGVSHSSPERLEQHHGLP